MDGFRYIATLDRIIPYLPIRWRRCWMEMLEKNTQLQRRWNTLFHLSHVSFQHSDRRYPPLPIDTEWLPSPYRKQLQKLLSDRQADGMLYQGDNRMVLPAICSRFEGKIHTIYIDPPYNTGNTHFDYLDCRSENEWRSMMHETLRYLLTLMHPEGALFVSIDDRQLPTLRSVAQAVGFDFVATFVRRSGIAPRQDARHIAVEHDYVVCFARNIHAMHIQHLPADLNHRKYPYHDEFLHQRGRFTLNKLDRGSIRYSPTMDYPIVVPKGTPIDIIQRGVRHPLRIAAPETIELWPGGDPHDRRWTWRWSNKKVKWGLQNRMLVFRKNANGWNIYFKQYQFVDNRLRPIKRKVPPRTLLLDYPNEKAARLLRNLFTKVEFTSYPKPVELIEQLIALNAPPDAWVMDCFAGSGTTAHAVMNLNRADGGARRFILVENQHYFHSVIIPRIQKVAYATRWKNGQPLDPGDGIGGVWEIFSPKE